MEIAARARLSRVTRTKGTARITRTRKAMLEDRLTTLKSTLRIMNITFKSQVVMLAKTMEITTAVSSASIVRRAMLPSLLYRYLTS